MITYDWKCKKCGHVQMGMVKSDEIEDAKKLKIPCPRPRCKGEMVWQFPAPAGRVH